MNVSLSAVQLPEPAFRRAFYILERVAADRAQIYSWLALSFYPPEPDFFASLENGRLVAGLRTATAWLGEDRLRLFADFNDLDRFCIPSFPNLRVEYEHLFVNGVQRVSPYETSYRWRDASDVVTAGNDLTRVLQQAYRQFGLAPEPGLEAHLAVELEFLAYLCAQEAGYWRRQSSASARNLRRLQRSFITDHLGRWLSEFAWRLKSRFPESFYAHLAGLCLLWVQLEHGPG